MRNLVLDLRFASRLLAAHRGFALVALLLLAIGIGVNVSVFSFVNGLMLRPLPYPNQERLVWVDERTPAGPDGMSVSFADFADWQARQRVFDALAAFIGSELTFTGGEQAESVQGVLATGDLFRVLGVAPLAGRVFGPDDDKPGAAPVVVIGYGLWQSRFGGMPVVGREVVVNGSLRTVVGVMPAGFNFPEFAEAWVPAALDAAAANRAAHGYFVVATLAPGVPIERARTDMSAIARQLAQEHPDTNSLIDALVVPIRHKLWGRGMGLDFLALMGAAGVFLLITCANLANLLLARAIERGREMAVRAALGASHWRIIRLLLTEGMLLAALGTAGGLLLGGWGRDALLALVPVAIPKWIHFDIDATVVAFAALLAVGTTLLFTLAPSLRASRPHLPAALREASTRSITKRGGRFFSVLVATQVALALVLLVGAGLMARSMINLLQSDPGFRPGNVLTLRVTISRSAYPDSDARRRFYVELMDRLSALPGVRRAGAATVLPTRDANWVPQIVPEGTAASTPLGGFFVANQVVVTPGYFDALGIRVIRGRGFTARDDHPGGPGVAIVNESFVRQHWPTGDPIGHRLQYRAGPGNNESPWLTVVGVVSDVLYRDTRQRAVTYLPHQQQPARGMNLAIWTATDPVTLAASVRRVIAGMDANIAPADIQSMDKVLASSRWQPLVISWLLGIFGILALILASVGIYGVVVYTVSRRTHEIGIRMALGADTRQVRRSVLRRTLAPVGAGVLVGLLASYVVGGLLRPLLYAPSPSDLAITLGGMTLVLLGVAAAACYVPARRASRMDPIVALRWE